MLVISIFSAGKEYTKPFRYVDGKFPGVGTLELSNPRGGDEKRGANALSSINTATFFH